MAESVLTTRPGSSVAVDMSPTRLPIIDLSVQSDGDWRTIELTTDQVHKVIEMLRGALEELKNA